MERRHHIMSVAIECFIKNGIHQTGIRDIAKQANVSLGNLYNHFASKDDLIAEIAVIDGQNLDRFAIEITGAENPLIALRKFVDHYLDYVSDAENAFLTIELISEALRNPIVAEQFDSSRQCLIDVLSATIELGISKGLLRAQTNVDETVRLLLDAVEGLGLRSGFANKKPSDDARKALHEMIFRMLLKRFE
ncbi:MAG: TetR/AcrR family transcriptional regulator [Granulosicoccaceae bacterium]